MISADTQQPATGVRAGLGPRPSPGRGKRMTWPGRAGSPRDFLRPHIVFLYICFLYIAFPSNHFNADGLHYNLIAYLSTVRPSALFRDHSVPAHFLWHLMSLGLLRVFRPASPEQSLYILRAANIALALGSIFVFMRLVRSLAGESTAAWATIALALSLIHISEPT